jgi:transposase
MSLPVFSTQGELFSTASLSGSLFAEKDRYRLFGKLVYPAVAHLRPKLATCYCAEKGRAAVEPVLLLGVSLLQYLDGVPDRQAVDLLRYHVGWNFALNRHVGDELFHPTTLVNFRQRLLEHEMSAIGFEAVLEALVEAGLVPRQSRQRLDSTHIFGRVSRMSRLECVRETLRLALEELAASTAQLPRPEFWTPLWERYVESKLDYRTEVSVLQQKMSQAGRDGLQVLTWIKHLTEPGPGCGEQVKLLRQVWQEQFELDAAGAVQAREAQPAGAVHNPHDPEAQWAAKGQGKHRKEHVGYKVQVAETVSEKPVAAGEPTPNFITAMTTQLATGSDDAGLPLVEAEQTQMGLVEPSKEWYVDGAYISAERLAQAQAQDRELIGPAQPSPKKEGRFSVEDFKVCVEERKAICPAGRPSTQCSRLEIEQSGKVNYRFEFGAQCHDCTLRSNCLGKDQKHRTILVGQHHSFLQARRGEQKTEAFQERVRRRNGIEGTQSELVRAHGLRQARYRGLEKTRLQNYLVGAACNIKRWIRRAAWKITNTIAAAGQAMNPAPAN